MISGIAAAISISTAVGLSVGFSEINLNVNASTASMTDAGEISVFTNDPAGFVLGVAPAEGYSNELKRYGADGGFAAIDETLALADIPAGQWGISTNGISFIGLNASVATTIFSTTMAGENVVDFYVGGRGSSQKDAGVYTGEVTFTATANIAPVRYTVIYAEVDENGGITLPFVITTYDSSPTHNFVASNIATNWSLTPGGPVAISAGESFTMDATSPTRIYYKCE